MNYERVANESELAEGRTHGVTLGDGREICLAKAGGQVYAVLDRCTHADYPLADGSVDGCEIECALHGAVFDLRDGAVVRDPAVEAVQTFPVRITNGGIWIGVGEE
jgi:nitrite reductase/ring-hydroxylating ferredoxin subunit